MNTTNSKQQKLRTPRYKLLPYATIQAATQGDPDAIAAVLRHYEGYIAKLSTRRLFDEMGNVYLCVDETMRRRLEIKLIAGILTFKVARPFHWPGWQPVQPGRRNTSQIETHFDTAAIRPKPTAPGGPVRAGDSPSICYNIRQTPLYLENCMTGQTGYAFPGKCAFARQGEQYVAE